MPTLCIDRLTIREIRLSLKEPFRISSGLMKERRIALLELTDRDGASVMSECVAFHEPMYSPETIDTAWLAIREWLAPRILGHQLLGNLARQLFVNAALDIGGCQFIELEFRLFGEFLGFACEVGIFGVRLRTDRDVFARRH